METRAIWASPAVLPSRGLLYGDSIPKGEVLVGPLVGGEEKMVATAGTGMASTVVDMLIANCVFDAQGEKIRNLPASHMLLGDRTFLMQSIRHVTHGPYPFNLRCPRCANAFSTSLNLPDDLQLVPLKDGFQEPFEIETPVSHLRFTMRLWRAFDQTAVSEWVKKRIKVAGENDIEKGDPAYFYRKVRTIIAVEFPVDHEDEKIGRMGEQLAAMYGGPRLDNDGDQQVEEKLLNLLSIMHSRDTTAVKNAVFERDCGVRPEHTFTCPSCSWAFEAVVPGEADFFRPTTREGVVNFE